MPALRKTTVMERVHLPLKTTTKLQTAARAVSLQRVDITVPVLVVETARTPLISQSLAAKSQRSAETMLPALAAAYNLMVQTLSSKEMPL